MSNSQDLQEHIGAINAIDEKEVKQPNMPVAIAIQEAEDLAKWCLDDKEVLVKAGLNWTIVEGLSERAGACRELQSVWAKNYQTKQEAQKEWKIVAPGAYDLRDVLLHHLEHAFREDVELSAKVDLIRKGSGHADMIQDLNDLALLAEENNTLYNAANLDTNMIVEARKYSGDLGELLAVSNGDKLESNNSKIMRDKAYTHLQSAVKEVRYYGQYAFWRNPDRKKGYVSNYHKTK